MGQNCFTNPDRMPDAPYLQKTILLEHCSF
jgi:hypothetical protein